MSDPFSEIDNEVNVEKIKNFLHKYKIYIVIVLFIIIILPSTFFYLKQKNEKKDVKVSGYFIEIIALLQSDEDRALEELEKLSKIDHRGLNFLSELIKVKISLKNKRFKEAQDILNEIELRISNKNNKLLKKITTFYYAQASLELNDGEGLNEKVGELLSFGDSWALLGHEIRGHYHLKNNDYKRAKKDFQKILNEQQSSLSLRSRAQEMLQNIDMYDETNN